MEMDYTGGTGGEQTVGRWVLGGEEEYSHLPGSACLPALLPYPLLPTTTTMPPPAFQWDGEDATHTAATCPLPDGGRRKSTCLGMPTGDILEGYLPVPAMPPSLQDRQGGRGSHCLPAACHHLPAQVNCNSQAGILPLPTFHSLIGGGQTDLNLPDG